MSTLLVEVKPQVQTPFHHSRYENFIGGNWVPPASGRYFDNISPVDGRLLCRVPRSESVDVEAALDAAHAAKDSWGALSATERSNILNRIAQRMEWIISTSWRSRKPGITGASLSARQRTRTYRSPSIIFGILPKLCARTGRFHFANRRDHCCLPFSRASGCCRSDHSVEFSDPDGGLENRSGTGRG